MFGKLILNDFKPEWLREKEIPIYLKKIYKNKTRGKVLAYFLIDNRKYPVIIKNKRKIVFNFDIEKTIGDLLEERYAEQKRPLYTYAPFHYHLVPFRLQINRLRVKLRKKTKEKEFPSWPIDKSVELLRWFSSLNKKTKKAEEKNNYVVVLSHDVDSSCGFKNIPKFLKIEDEKGVKSTWNIVGRYYKLDYKLLDKLHKGGHEIALHGFNHDNKIAFLGKEKIRERLNRCLKFIERYDIRGFRSPALITSKNLFEVLPEFFEYDSSVADTEIFIPGSEKRGCCSVFPFFKNTVLELPLTIPMDSTLLVYNYKAEDIYKIWTEKLEFIKRVGGIAVLTTHTDSYFSGNEKMLKLYSKILDFVIKDNAVIMTAKEAADYWKKQLGKPA